MRPHALQLVPVAVVAGLMVLAAGARAEEAPVTTPIVHSTFVGTLLYLGDHATTGSTATLRVHVNALTSVEDVDHLADTLEQHGENALENELGSRDVGYLQIGERFPERLAAAYVEEIDGARHLVLITERDISAREIFANRRSADYRFRVIEITLDERGNGAGEMIPFARLRVEKDGSLGARNLDVLPSRVFGWRAIT
jgi:hypothetical protein